MASTTATRAAVSAGVVAALAAAYFIGGVHTPGTVAALPAQSTSPGTAAEKMDTVSVGGVGKISGTPDTLLLQLQVETRAADVSKALNAANAAQSKVAAALKTRGVAAADLQTSGLGVQADYNFDNNKQTLVGYIASESLSVKLRNLDKAGETISAAVSAGGNDVRVNGASLDLEGNSELVKQARASAFADAKAKAEQYAKLAGRELGAVSTVSEQVQDSPPVPTAFAAAGVADSAKSVPIERGSQVVAVNVQVVWSLR